MGSVTEEGGCQAPKKLVSSSGGMIFTWSHMIIGTRDGTERFACDRMSQDMSEVQSQFPDSWSGLEEDLGRRIWPEILAAMSYKLIDRVPNSSGHDRIVDRQASHIYTVD